MIQTVCDKCGKIINDVDMLFEIRISTPDIPVEETGEIRYDFCKDCFMEVRDVLMGETKHDIIEVPKRNH